MILKLQKIIFGLVFFHTSFSSYADQSYKNILYEVSKENIRAGHLLGIMHAFPAGKEITLLPTTIDVIARSDGVFTELGLSQFLLLNKSVSEAIQTVQGTQRLSSIIPATQIKQITSQLAPILGDNTKQIIENGHPWMIAQTLSGLCPVSMNPVQMEAEILLVASSKEKPIIALESVLDQVKALPSYNSPIWPEYLNAVSRSVARHDCSKIYTQMLKNLADVFIAGKVDALISTVEESYSFMDARKLDEVSVFGRNPQLLSRILKRIESGKIYLFAIGANHLVGSTGIIASLESAGYTIKKIE